LRTGAALAAAAVLSLGIAGSAAAAGPPGPPGHVLAGTPSALTAAQVAQLSADATHHSIIIFKNQLSSLPASSADVSARITAANTVQAGVMSELKQVHAGHVSSFHIVDAVAATISATEASRLAADPAVSAVVPDARWHFTPQDSGPGPISPASVQAAGGSPASAPTQQVCPASPADPLIEPEARHAMNADAADQVADGSGVKVGVIADGVDQDNPDLIRADGQHVVFDYEDFSGDGPGAPTDGREAFLDAGTIASQGNETYDLSGFVNPTHPLPAGCTIKIEGIAPGASLAVLNVSGSNGGFTASQAIQAIEWAVLHDHVNVLNESFGTNPVPDTQDDPVALADEAAVAAGVTVVTASGDSGPFNDIGSPASAPGVIAVGATTTYQIYRQTTAVGSDLMPGGWENNNISALSSAGVTEVHPHTVDVVAPGDGGWSLCSSDTTEFRGCADPEGGSDPPPIWAAAGTSASAPETSGTAALVIEAYAKTHGGRLPAPALVGQVIVSTATDLDAPADHQGAGLVNTLKAVQLAESIGTASPQGNTLLVNRTGLNATVTAGQSAAFSVRVTNEGSGPQTVTPTVSGNPAQVSSDTGTVQLSQDDPTYTDSAGTTDYYAPQTFTVPAGTDNLDGDITWRALFGGGPVYETLFDPLGQLAAYSLIDSNQSGHGHVEVHNPVPGTWTAVIFTSAAAPNGGPVQFAYTTERFSPAGAASPASQTLAPGQSATFRITVPAGQSGDEALKLHVGTGGATDGSIPVVLRALVPVSADGASFNGTLTGGGSSFNSGEQLTYQFQVPRGKSSLNLGISLAAPYDYGLEGFLIDPNGEPLDAQTTGYDFIEPGPAMQFYLAAPEPGRWTLVLLVALPSTSVNQSEPFTGTLSFSGPPVTSTGIPNSSRTVLPAGQPVTATITVTNTGGIAKDFFADPRLNGKVPQELLGNGTNDVALPPSFAPWWPVPTNTSQLTVAAQGTVPITMDVSWISGDPDVAGRSFGDNSVATLTAPEVAPGLFFGLPEATGPFTAAATGTVNLAAVADTNPFDAAVTASTGDVWAETVNADAPYTPLTLAPGHTGTITLTFTPSAPKGTLVRGFIGVDTYNGFSVSGDVLANIPYTYKVG
jgi:subtilisin family serine protease